MEAAEQIFAKCCSPRPVGMFPSLTLATSEATSASRFPQPRGCSRRRLPRQGAASLLCICGVVSEVHAKLALGLDRFLHPRGCSREAFRAVTDYGLLPASAGMVPTT